ncbi:DUF1353 domain-containing protein [Thiobaca trueperi]|uniref:Uncharacterized protein DUF1353 n=1 Tax=Thiobaca trueperi TaxID=127458 RepID=A0A4R3N3E9_9GAMM|nr:DUF1353 domain-containing protein [Thiobaca trueperi]TCT21199.1 uncharacterized protein DUF1353 [Thiobaca trueperi]
MNAIAYKGGYRYQLQQDLICPALAPPDGATIRTRFIDLTAEGWLTIRAGYAWDGPSGPTLHSPSFMRGSLIHDALYQLIREGHLPRTHRRAADRLLYDLCRRDGMWAIRAAWVWLAVRLVGGLVLRHAANPIRYAPEGRPT